MTYSEVRVWHANPYYVICKLYHMVFPIFVKLLGSLMVHIMSASLTITFINI